MTQKVSGKVLFIALVAALGGILFGYDTAVISGTTEVVKMQFGLTTGGEGWYVGCALIGSIVGVLIAGMLSDFLGRKKTMLISALLFSVSAIGCALSADFTQLVIYRMIGGFGIGIVSIVSPVYISEVSPAEVRGTMVSLYQLFITIGFLLAYLANYLIRPCPITGGPCWEPRPSRTCCSWCSSSSSRRVPAGWPSADRGRTTAKPGRPCGRKVS